MSSRMQRKKGIMMWTLVLRTSVAVIISFLATEMLSATGAKVSILLKSGEKITGELLIVTDSLLMISRGVGLTQDKLEADMVDVFKIGRGDIRDLAVCGKSYVPDGVLLGTIFGIGVGALLSYEPTGTEAYGSNFDPQGAGPNAIIIGLAGGAILGGFAGMMASTNDQEVELEGRKNLLFLKDLSRYYERDVPKFLQNYLGVRSE